MPTRTKNRKTSRAARTGIDAGDCKKEPGCKESKGSTANGATVIANSLFALTLAPKTGLEVITKVDRKKQDYHYEDRTENYDRMYHDLLKVFQRTLTMVTGEVSKFNPLASGLDLSQSITYVLKAFENNILPKGFNYNIDRNEQGYYFTIYKETDCKQFWHSFEIKVVIMYLEKANPRVLQLFLQVIKGFISKADINAWWNGGHGYVECIIDEDIDYWYDNHDSEDDEEVEGLILRMEAYQDYEYGEAKYYETVLKNMVCKPASKILSDIKNVKTKSWKVKRILGWMKEACHFLELPGSVGDFIYRNEMEDSEEGLRYDQQSAILWDEDDIYTMIELECLDSDVSGCGIILPVTNMPIYKDDKKIDFQELLQRDKWPIELYKINTSYVQMLADIKISK